MLSELFLDRIFVSVQSPVKQVQAIEPAVVETSPTGQPYRPRPGNSGEDALAVDSQRPRSASLQQTGSLAGSGCQSSPCATAPRAAVPAPQHCSLLHPGPPEQRSTELPSALSTASTGSSPGGLPPKPVIQQLGKAGFDGPQPFLQPLAVDHPVPKLVPEGNHPAQLPESPTPHPGPFSTPVHQGLEVPLDIGQAQGPLLQRHPNAGHWASERVVPHGSSYLPAALHPG
jgi:hypothetical protein